MFGGDPCVQAVDSAADTVWQGVHAEKGLVDEAFAVEVPRGVRETRTINSMLEENEKYVPLPRSSVTATAWRVHREIIVNDSDTPQDYLAEDDSERASVTLPYGRLDTVMIDDSSTWRDGPAAHGHGDYPAAAPSEKPKNIVIDMSDILKSDSEQDENGRDSLPINRNNRLYRIPRQNQSLEDSEDSGDSEDSDIEMEEKTEGEEDTDYLPEDEHDNLKQAKSNDDTDTSEGYETSAKEVEEDSADESEHSEPVRPRKRRRPHTPPQLRIPRWSQKARRSYHQMMGITPHAGVLRVKGHIHDLRELKETIERYKEMMANGRNTIRTNMLLKNMALEYSRMRAELAVFGNLVWARIPLEKEFPKSILDTPEAEMDNTEADTDTTEAKMDNLEAEMDAPEVESV